MTTDQTHDEFTRESEAALTAKLEAWAMHLPPREQQVLALVLSRAATERAEVHGHGGAGGGGVNRHTLADMLDRFLVPQGVRPGSGLDISPFGRKPGVGVGNDREAVGSGASRTAVRFARQFGEEVRRCGRTWT